MENRIYGKLYVSWSALVTLISYDGTPNLSRINDRGSLSTRSKAFTRSKKRTHVYWLCSRLFFKASLTVKIVSVHPLPGQNPHCDLWSRLSEMVVSLWWTIFAMILYAISSSIIYLCNCQRGSNHSSWEELLASQDPIVLVSSRCSRNLQLHLLEV